MTATSEELSPAVYNSIQIYSAKGDQLAAEKSYGEAIAEYNKAWELVPDPKNQWNASTWILAAIADAAFLAGYKTSAREALQYAMTCPDAVGNPFLHLRYGEVLLDSGEEDAAAEELMRAYIAEGEEIFSAEDPRYFEFLKARANI